LQYLQDVFSFEKHIKYNTTYLFKSVGLEKHIPIISVENISKKYQLSQKNNVAIGSNENIFWALKDISFTLQKGDVLGLIGMNGSGKTTLLKLLSRSAKPSSGRIVQRGKVIPILDIGTGFHPDLTGRANIFLYSSVMLGLSKNEVEQTLEHIISFSELDHFIDEPVKNYSNGMYLRLALSIALFCELDILLMDEVFSVGDNAFMVKSYDKMNQIIKQAATVVLASHNMDDILRICNKCLWLDRGQIKMFGHTDEVFAAYSRANQQLIESNSTLSRLKLKTEHTWLPNDLPHSTQFKLLSIRINNIDDTGEIDYNSDIIVEIIYKKNEPDIEIDFTLVLTDHYGTALLSATQQMGAEVKNASLYKTGKIKAICTIPGQLLNLGIYKLNLRVLQNQFNTLFFLTDVLTFRVIAADQQTMRILTMTPIKFVPSLNWQLSILSST